MRDLIGIFVAGTLVTCVYFFGHHVGYDDARGECQTASLQSQLLAQARIADNLKHQMTEQQTVLDAVTAEKLRAEDAVAQARGQVMHVFAAKDCSLGADAIDGINTARAGGGQ